MGRQQYNKASLYGWTRKILENPRKGVSAFGHSSVAWGTAHHPHQELALDIFANIPFSLLSFAVIASITPGPNNILVMSQGITHGLRSTLAYQAGAGCACFVIMLAVMSLGHHVEKMLPDFMALMTWAGCAYMLYLAWVVACSQPQAVGAPRQQAHFWLGVGLQFVNPKYYLYVLTLAAVLLPLVRTVAGMVLLSCFFALVAVVGMFLWALCGSVLQDFLRQHYRLSNGIMALALVYCALSLFL